ncbi:hypothetical protein DRW48_10460 [Paracoccus suum]|uniref:Uncharacterized protein n=1 Tax=Paracoccus suum TaxID=2259340 RepID=A0A344PL01_9RHOB|nr:hypothetical protein [Paracoccus suum]AXC50056.1 hypothetical protein DRW48_10460 [Paracoccus suum]
MKKSTYMDRAMRAKDPRFAAILGKLGYERTDLRADDAAEAEAKELAQLRDRYQEIVGKRAYHGWNADTLREKIAEAAE